jgi:hypothetical protein
VNQNCENHHIDGMTSESWDVRRLASRDWGIVVVLFLIALAMRLPFRSHFAYHWDSAQFALAVREFDIRLSQPHAPGYFLYVMLGRLVNHFVGDPHASLVWISVMFGSALPSLLYLLGTMMFGRRAGAAAAAMALTSPQIWFHSCVALTYIVDSFLVCAVVLVLWLAIQRGGRWWDAVAVGALLAVLGGVRQQSVLELAPLVLFGFWRFQRARAVKLAMTAIVAGGLGLLWFMPMVRMSGGLKAYLSIARLHASFNASATVWGNGWDALLQNVANMTGFCLNGLMFATVVLVAALLHRAIRMTDEQKRAWDSQNALALQVLAIWIVPMMVFGTVVGFTKQPGYVLSYLPAMFLLTAVVVASLKKPRHRSATIMAICIVNVVSFVAWPALWDRVFFEMARTAHEIATHDADISRIDAAIRKSYPPSEIVIGHAQEFYLYGIRIFQLHLPEYEQYQMATDSTVFTPPDKRMWRVRDGRLDFVEKPDLKGKKGMLLLVPPAEKVEIFAPYLSAKSMKAAIGGECGLYFIPSAEVEIRR